MQAIFSMRIGNSSISYPLPPQTNPPSRLTSTDRKVIIQNMNGARKFVIQKHTKAGQTHWDLMFEQNSDISGPGPGTLLETYRLESPPEKLSQQITVAVKIFDHSPKFLTYEGSVNNGKGTVEIVENGIYQLLNHSENSRELQLEGKMLKGRFALNHIKDNRWEFKQH